MEKKVKILPIIKPGKENSTEVTKFRPISLTNVAGKILEKLLINRIMHVVYRNELAKRNQYGFTPQKIAIDAAIEVKEYLEEGRREYGSILNCSLGFCVLRAGYLPPRRYYPPRVG
jgi:hypothetical protein